MIKVIKIDTKTDEVIETVEYVNGANVRYELSQKEQEN